MRKAKRLQMKSRMFFLFVLFMLFENSSLLAQAKTLSGVIINSKTAEPLAGATVTVKGTTTSTSTANDGKFTIQAASKNPVLVITNVGFETQEITVDNATPKVSQVIIVKLVNSISELSDVVVVGYGKQKKATLTGAVETISAKAFENRAITNIGLALQGATPGLLVTRSSPRPGNEGINLVIRGVTSVNGTSPLIIIDGVPALNSYLFFNMNPDDIENISILKDASAAIYGSAAANGVVLVTTKRGKGKTRYDFSSNMRFTTNGITGYSPSMQQYATMWIEANKEETNPNWWVWGNKENMLKMQQGVEGAYPLFGIDYYIFNANRINEMFATRYSYQNNLSISGGDEKTAYRLSLLMADNQGNLATAYDGQKQYNARFNYDIKLSKKLKLETAISMVNANTSTPSAGLDATLFAFDMPFFPAKNAFGQWFACFNGVDGGANRNAAARTSDGGRDSRNSLTGRVDLKAIYQVHKDFSIEGLASLQNERFNQESYLLAVPVYNWYGKQTGWAGGLDTTRTSYFTNAWTGVTQYYQLLMRYNKTVKGLHNFSAVAGIDAQKTSNNWVSANRTLFTDLGVQNIRLATGIQTNDGGSSQVGNYAYLARFNYGYADKYLLELQGRIDGSSRFAKGYKFQQYGGVSAGWVFSKEDFLSGINSVLDFGKIRASWGSVGNQATNLGIFDYLTLVRTGNTVLGSPVALQTTSSTTDLTSYTRTWERVVQKNIALDLGFLRNRLTTTVEYFTKDNIGMLIGVSYPSVLGGNPPATNNGHLSVKGWEAMVKWSDTKKNFSYNIAATLSDTRTMVIKVQGADNYNAGRNGMVNGLPLQSWFLYKTDGYFKDQAEVDAYYAKYGASPDLAGLPQNNLAVALRPGDIKKIDVSGKGNITGSGNANSSLVYAGDGAPHYLFGINLGGSWKGLDLTAFFQGHLKQSVMRGGYMAYPFSAVPSNQNPAFLGKTWTTENTEAIYPRLTVNNVRARWNYANNDFMLQNNRYIRLKTLVLGYSLPQSLLKKVRMERVRVYFSGNDLWETSKIKDGFDPEMGETSQNSGYPFARTWSFGVNVGF